MTAQSSILAYQVNHSFHFDVIYENKKCSMLITDIRVSCHFQMLLQIGLGLIVNQVAYHSITWWFFGENPACSLRAATQGGSSNQYCMTHFSMRLALQRDARGVCGVPYLLLYVRACGLSPKHGIAALFKALHSRIK